MERAEALGFTPMLASELEFYLLQETFAEAHAKGYDGLTPSVPYILDYHVLATTYDEPLLRAIRNGMQGAGIRVETSKGEAWPGQQEINFRFADALTMADNHVVYKNGAKEIAFLHGRSITFMAKPFQDWIGNSCHIHSSLSRDGSRLRRRRDALRSLVGRADRVPRGAGRLPGADDQLLQALRGRLLGAHDDGLGARQPDVRIPGRWPRAGAADGDAHPRRRVNPYLAFAAVIAAGLHGIEHELELPPPLEGNAYESDAKRFPASLREATAALEHGTMARAAFGDHVVDHYLNYARTEQALYDKTVTDWERKRYFERG